MGLTERRAAIFLGAVLALALAVPAVIAADPSSSPEASASTAPETSSPEASAPEASSPEAPASESASPESSGTPGATPTATPAPPAVTKPSPAPQETGEPDNEKEKNTDGGFETPITVTGMVNESTNHKGWKTYALTAGSKTYELSAGPPWFWGDKNPLAPYVGKTVTVVGTTDQGSTEIDAETVDGKALREPGKPPWAGGPWVVGERHPGWKPWMAGGKHGQGHGRDHAPGQLKDKSGASDDSSDGDATGSSGLR
jgi:hypothetical protein